MPHLCGRRPPFGRCFFHALGATSISVNDTIAWLLRSAVQNCSPSNANAAWFERKRAKRLDQRCIIVDAKTIEASVAPLFVDGREVKRTVDDRHTHRAALQLHFAHRGTAFVEFEDFLTLAHV